LFFPLNFAGAAYIQVRLIVQKIAVDEHFEHNRFIVAGKYSYNGSLEIGLRIAV